MTQCAMGVSEAGFRSVMARFATGVTVITSVGSGGPAGMTANAVASLSLEPVLVMVGFELQSRTLAVVRQSGVFAVNVLANDQEEVSRLFAGKQSEAEKFAGCGYGEWLGVPVIDGALAWLCCRVDAVYPGGDHVIVVGNVVEMGGSGGEPLLFYGGDYRRLDGPGGTGGAGRPRSARPAYAAGTGRRVRPVVGVTGWPATVAEGFIDVPVQAVPEGYLEMLGAVGLAALLIPVSGPADSAADVLGRVDGLLLTGGGDVAPQKYAAQQRPQTSGINARRDAVEIELVRLARRRGLPILAVCRGIQLLNVALGGTLIQDLPTADPPRQGHMALQSWNGAAHQVLVEPGTLLHRLLGPEASVNSLHHQAVETVAPGLRVAARAPDGVIEAVEDSGTRFVVGLQWHPEMLGSDHASFAVFRQFAVAITEAVSSVVR